MVLIIARPSPPLLAKITTPVTLDVHLLPILFAKVASFLWPILTLL